MGRRLLNMGAAVAAVLLLWFIASWVDVVLHNLDPNPVYQWWNLFVLLF